MRLSLLTALIYFFIFSIALQAQTGLEEQIEAAKAELKRVEALYSKQHIFYADQALLLADLYYQNYTLIGEGVEDADALAIEALRFYRDSLGVNSDKYFEALKILPAEQATFHHLSMNVEDASPENKQAYAYHLIQLTKYYYNHGDFTGYDYLVRALRNLGETPLDNREELLKGIPEIVLKLINIQLELEKACQQTFDPSEDLLDSLRLENGAIAQTFGDFMQVFYRIYEDMQKRVNQNLDLLPFVDRTVYLGFRELLNYYKDRDAKKFEEIYQQLSTEFQSYYDLETRFQEMLATHQTTTESFYEFYRFFLNELEGDMGSFLDYSIDDTFDKILEDIRKYQLGGEQNPYYQRVVQMKRNQRLSKAERFIFNERSALKSIKDSLQHFSEEYIQRLIKLAAIEFDEVKEEAALEHYQEAISIAQKMDKGLKPEADFDFNLDDLELGEDDWDLSEEELDLDLEDWYLGGMPDSLPKKQDTSLSLEEKYMAQIPQPWRQFILNEQAIDETTEQQDKNALAYLEAACFYLEQGILEIRAEEYLEKGLNILSGNEATRQQALQLMKRIALKDWNRSGNLYSLFEYKELLFNVFTKEELDPFIQTILDLVENYFGGKEKHYAEVLALKADLNYLDDDPQSNIDALELYKEALRIFLGTEGKYLGYYELLVSMTQKAQEDENDWPVETTAEFFEQRLEIAKEIDLSYGELSWHYFEALLTYINWHYEVNRYVSAEAKIKELLSVLAKQDENTKKQYQYDKALHQLARVYRKTGRYPAAFEYYQKAISKASDYENYNLLIEALDGQGLLLQDVGEYDKAFETFDKSLDYFELYELEGKLNRRENFSDAFNYIKLLRHIGRLHFDVGDYDLAMDYYNQVMGFEEKSNWVSFEKDLSLQRDLALWYDYAFEDEKAIFYYKNAIAKLKDLSDVADAHIKLADFYIRRGQDSLAKPHFEEALDIDLSRLKANYANLAEAERLLFLNTLMPRIKTFYSFVATQQDPKLLEKMLNTHLIIKGLALENTTNIRSVVYASENVKLKNIYAEMQSLRQQLAAAAGLTKAELAQKAIDLEQLSKEIKAKEEAISRESKTLRAILERQNKQVNFQKLKALLPKDAVAVDFMIISQKTEDEELQDFYYAFLVRPQDSFPKLIRLCTVEDLNYVLEAEVQPNGLNYITDPSESYFVYSLVWEPLSPYLDACKKVHLCPTGSLTKLAFATLYIDDFSGKRLIERYSLIYHTALRDLLERPVIEGASMNINPDIMLVGGVQFDMKLEELKQALKDVPNTINLDDLEDYGSVNYSINRRGLSKSFNYLPGTLKEVNRIKEVFEEKKWKTQLLTGVAPIEQAFTYKIREKVPVILHIATHGFFFSEQKESFKWQAREDWAPKTIAERLAREQNPLLRSGLALAGINHVWEGGARIAGLQDGILTAYEVANLDLFGTELVVLSACETGQGDINNNEGVIGLQRAFKMAGARRLIISLWKVPDAQTAELMTLFYQNYLEGKMNMQEAFEQAQHEMKKRYSNAYYWAAFILVE